VGTSAAVRSLLRGADGWSVHALQCGYCTPGMLMSATALLRANAQPCEVEIKKGLHGNICRCTGYWNIFEAVKTAAERGSR
jgi:aerobic carbon-monoxide dehydrogenase small subunit